MNRETIAQWVYQLQDFELEHRGKHGAAFDEALTNALVNLRAFYHEVNLLEAHLPLYIPMKGNGIHELWCVQHRYTKECVNVLGYPRWMKTEDEAQQAATFINQAQDKSESKP